VSDGGKIPSAMTSTTRLAGLAKTLGAALTVLASAAFASGADPVFVLHQPLTHTLSPHGRNVIPILLSSSEEVTEVRVSVVQVRTPRGQLLPLDLFTLEQPPATLGPTGSPFS
jgi:predicted acyl esterase